MTDIPNVKQFMTKKIISLRPEMDIYDAINILLKHKISGAPVVDADHVLVGILSEKDCLRMFTEAVYDKSPGGKVSDFMSKTLVTCTEEQDLFCVADLFFKNSFRRMPVLRDGKLIGLVSRPDVLKGSIALWQSGGAKKAWSDSVYLTEEIKAALK
jgi:CBS domain-containing protein